MESNLHSGENREGDHGQLGSSESNNNDQGLVPLPQLQQPQNQQCEKRPLYTDHQDSQHQQQPVHYGEVGRYQPQLQLNLLPPQQQYLQPQTYPNSQQYLQPRQQPISQQGLFSIPIPQVQPHLVPLQTPNYVPNSYQQLPIQSPYNVTAQPPHFGQFNPGLPQLKSRHSLDSRFDDGHGNLLSYNQDRGLVSSIPSIHANQQAGGINESGEHGMGSESSSFNAGSTTTLGQSSIHSQFISSRGSTTTSSTTPLENVPLNENQKSVASQCTRCKKDFVQVITVPKENNNSFNFKPSSGQSKVFKLCHHCRELQRQRSRRWQMKTKDKKGVCRRCGTEIPFNEQKFVLCPSCRLNLRTRKASRASQGKCIHCSSPMEDGFASDEISLEESSSVDEYDKRSPKSTSFRVCQKCRGKDKLRRHNLQQMGYCNRCTKALSANDHGKYKLCADCRAKKKQYGNKGQQNSPPQMHYMGPGQLKQGDQLNNGYASQPASLQSYANQHYTPYPQYSSHNNNANVQLPFPSHQPAPYVQSFLPHQIYTSTHPVVNQQPLLHPTSLQGAQQQPPETNSQNQSQNQNLQGQGQDYYSAGDNNYSERRA